MNILFSHTRLESHYLKTLEKMRYQVLANENVFTPSTIRQHGSYTIKIKSNPRATA